MHPIQIDLRIHFLVALLACTPSLLRAQERVASEAVAISGDPIGVATILIPIGNVATDLVPRVHLSEENDRVLYPSVGLEPLPARIAMERGDGRSGIGPLRDKIRRAIQSGRDTLQPPQGMRVSFLFQGDAPLRLQLRGDVDVDFVLQPEVNAKAHGDFFRLWWKFYQQEAKTRLQKGDYPPLLETYLTGMLAGRFQFPFPDLRDPSKKKKWEEPISTLSLLANTEEIRRECMIEAMQPPLADAHKRLPLPPPPQCKAPVPPEMSPDLPIEPIARVVPPECYYLRFGNFANFLWYDQLSDRRSGDLSQLAMLRGFNYETSVRLEKLLNTKMTTLTKLFGDSVIADMAIIGRDLYVQEGPSLGVVVEAKNPGLLRSTLQQERLATADKGRANGVRLETIPIRGHEVSFLHSPDNSVRSFVVEHDRFFFITTSRKLAERFLEVADGEPSLASTPNFQFSRLLLPNENNYTIYAYLSPEFFRGLISPGYQIELRRRLTALAHLEMAEMALLVARAEKKEANSIEDLIKLGYLPKWFHDRVDETQTLRDGDHWIDSLRGARGSFLPIADVEVPVATPKEVVRYQEQAQFYERDWKQTDPLAIGIRRFVTPNEPTSERVTIEAYIAPFGREKYGWISAFLAPPVESMIQLPPDDVANLQVHMAGTQATKRPVPDHVMFLGLKDLVPPKPGETKGLIQTLRTLSETPAYLGAWPLPGHLDSLPLGLGGGPPDALGFSRMLLGLWRWQAGGFSLLSFDRSILENCMQHLAVIPANDPAQARLKIGNLAGSHLSQWVNGIWYKRGLATTTGNLRLLDAVHQQLHVPQEEALEVLQRILNCRLQCPLGGKYECEDGGLGVWRSTHAPQSSRFDYDAVPADYQAPWLEWFRGGQVHLTQLEDRLVLIGQFDIEPLPPVVPDAQDVMPLPSMNFDLFSLPFQFMKSDGKKEKQAPTGEKRRKF